VRARLPLRSLLALAIALGARGAGACSVCLAGDPSFSTHGAAAQEKGRVSAYLELRGWEKSSGLLAHDHGAPVVEPAAPAAANDDHHHEDEEPAITPFHAAHEHEHDEPGSDAAATMADPHAEHGHGGSERSESRRLDLYVSWTPLDRLTLTVGLPWAWNQIEELEDGGSTHYSLSGFGDASLGVSGVVWRNRDVLPSTWLELRGWGKAPTGRDEQRVGGVRDPHLQTGTGSWDFGFGAAAVHRMTWGSLYASAFYRENTEGALDYEFGDVVLATAALEAPLGHALGRPVLDRVTPGLALDFRWAERDRQDGADYDDSGGAILYVTPSLRIALPAFRETQRAWLRAAVQVPTTNEWLYGEQDEDPVWSVGVGYGF
jgi:hypothetical protein